MIALLPKIGPSDDAKNTKLYISGPSDDALEQKTYIHCISRQRTLVEFLKIKGVRGYIFLAK